jgi:predicted nuclease of restriction endonuclease-like (RecB) superfamily
MDLPIFSSYTSLLQHLKQRITSARQKTLLSVNRELLIVYWEVGHAILQQQNAEGWGAKVIDRLAVDLRTEFPDMRGFSIRNLKYMRAFAQAYPNFVQRASAQIQSDKSQSITIVQQLAAQLSWSHHQILLDKLQTREERNFYIRKSVENGWSRNILSQQIESCLHLRQGTAITNFEKTLPPSHSDLAQETFKNPYLFDFLDLTETMQERELEKALIEHIKKFTLELGRGFAYVGNQHQLTVEGDDYFLDLLFFNYQLNCFVVFELKVGEFKSEYTGKLNFYINTINQQLKGKDHKPTIGILLCKTPNNTVIEYALQGINTPMGVAEYGFTKALPKQFKTQLPSIEELEQEIEKEVKEMQSPLEARLLAVKEKISQIQAEQLKTQGTFEVLSTLFREGLTPLYQQLIQTLSANFHEHFLTHSIQWNCGNKVVHSIQELEAIWSNPDNLHAVNELSFTYQMDGFRKAGTENMNEWIQLIFIIDKYWYGFRMTNYNKEQPFLKKLYHEPMTEKDIADISEIVLTKVIDRIEWIIDYVNNKKLR